MSVNNEATADTIKLELPRLDSREFAYQGVFQRTGLRRRDQINKVIDANNKMKYRAGEIDFVIREALNKSILDLSEHAK